MAMPHVMHFLLKYPIISFHAKNISGRNNVHFRNSSFGVALRTLVPSNEFTSISHYRAFISLQLNIKTTTIMMIGNDSNITDDNKDNVTDTLPLNVTWWRDIVVLVFKTELSHRRVLEWLQLTWHGLA